MVGSGGLVVMNQQTCMVSVARFFMQFAQNESCGKCVLCREGTQQMLARSWTTSSRAGPTRTRWNSWISWPWPCAKARSADWARRRLTPCSRRCGSSAPRSRPTSFRSAARRAAARRCSRRKYWPSVARAARSARRNAPSARSKASEKLRTRSCREVHQVRRLRRSVQIRRDRWGVNHLNLTRNHLMDNQPTLTIDNMVVPIEGERNLLTWPARPESTFPPSATIRN